MLGHLCAIGRGWAFDYIAEQTNISEEMYSQFFHDFVQLLAADQFAEWVHTPTDDAQMLSMTQYTDDGFPGAFGSIDGVHIPWERWTKRLRINALGKWLIVLCLSRLLLVPMGPMASTTKRC